MELLCGSSGFSYPPWRGSFYPDKLKTAEMLTYYASKLATVELNNTFYRWPKVETLSSWAEQVPPGFRFALKAPKRITHEGKLTEVDDFFGHVMTTSAAMGERRGPFLFQLPPFSRKDMGRLRHALEKIPEGVQAAFEFRHASWLDDEVYELLSSRNMALCLADTDEAEPPLVATASWGYLRLRKTTYSDAELDAWFGRITGQAWQTAFIYFKHEDAGQAPRLAQSLLARLAAAKEASFHE